MTTGRIGVGLVIVMLIQAFPLVATASEDRLDAAGPDLTRTKLIERMDRLESTVAALAARVVTLEREKQQAQESLKRQQETDAALKSRIESQTASVARPPSLHEQIDPREELRRHDLVNSWGVRAGYQGFPFGQKEGGFFYGIFLDHQLVQQSDGMPWGDLDLELGAGVGRSGNDPVTVNSSVVGAPTKVEFRQRMISIWPNLKYRFSFLQSYGIAPYVTGGPGVWVDIIETPPLVGGLQFATKELAARKLPVIAGASLFEGAQGGAGFDFSLARLNYPVFARIRLGFDYRYSAWTSGQRFSTYSLLLNYNV